MTIHHTILEQNDGLLPHITLGAAHKGLREYDEYLAESCMAGGTPASAFGNEDAKHPEGVGYTRIVSCLDPRDNQRVTLLKYNVFTDRPSLRGPWWPGDLERNHLSYILGLECTVAVTRGRSFSIVCKTNDDYARLIHMMKTGRFTHTTESGVMHGSFDCVQFKLVFKIG